MFETFEHTADVGLRIRAVTLESLFAEAARGLFSLIVPNLDSIADRQSVNIKMDGSDHDYLMFDWLNELLYQYEVKHLLLGHFDVRMATGGLLAVARGELVDINRHELDHEVKAITYHGLLVEQTTDGWLAECILDI